MGVFPFYVYKWIQLIRLLSFPRLSSNHPIVFFCKASFDTWHQRLGHPSHYHFNDLVTSVLIVICSLVCDPQLKQIYFYPRNLDFLLNSFESFFWMMILNYKMFFTFHTLPITYYISVHLWKSHPTLLIFVEILAHFRTCQDWGRLGRLR